tara:strand:- start:46 stop:324 length:279 start_codon:yes stop_codon:yes gene_type:complete
MTPNEISHYESLQKQDTENRKLIKKLQLDKQAMKEQLSLYGVVSSKRVNTKHNFVEIIKYIRRADKDNEHSIYDNTLVLAQNLILKYKIELK